ncbi:DUF4349 domain-containing protein [Paenibacillus ferrarius]|uniref:DUF4349 domain-containing protein n=1 Tax=Paenibacillus ferrarius TaxID=1469647 RepID=UPI003D2BE691
MFAAFKGKRWLAGVFIALLLLAGCSSAKDAGSTAASSAQDMKAVQPAKAEGATTATSDRAIASGQETKQSTSSQAQPAAIANAASASSASGQPAPSLVVTPTGADGVDGFNRKLIYKANLVMPVEDYAKAQTALRDLVALSGGYILQFSENATTGERGGTYTIKIAADGFVSLLDGLEKISPTLQRNVQGQDVTEEYVDLTSRLKAKQVLEERLLSFMEKATKTDDLLAFSNELSKVQEAIEQIKGRMRYLDQNVAYSTVELRMYQATGKKPLLADPNELTLTERVQKAWQSSLNVLVACLQGILVFLAAAFPVLVILLLLGIPFWAYRRKRRSKLEAIRAALQRDNALSEKQSASETETKDVQS